MQGCTIKCSSEVFTLKVGMEAVTTAESEAVGMQQHPHDIHHQLLIDYVWAL